MKLYSETNPNEATPMQKAKLVGIAKRNENVDSEYEHLRGSESDSAYFVSVGREHAPDSDLMRIAKPGSGLSSGEQTAAEREVYPREITRQAAAGAIELARRQ